jgi:glycosyltransferase involved in cell wall biosynthesis
LVVVEDGEENVRDLLSGTPSTYLRIPSKNLAAKRNSGIHFASGEYICHFDSDDWSGPLRVQDQMDFLLDHPSCDLTGYGETYWWDEVAGRASIYKGPMWGATLLYRRAFALAHPFPEDCERAEDTPFLLRASRCEQAGEHFVAIMHAGNQRIHGTTDFWPLVDYEDLPLQFRQAHQEKLCPQPLSESQCP